MLERIVQADGRLWAAALAFVALIVRLPLLVNSFESSVAPDTVFYMNVADGLIDGQGFDTEGVRTPVYPIFIALVQLLPGPTVDEVVVIQHLLGAAMAGAVFLVADRYFGRAAALLAGLAMVIAPMLMAIEHMVLPDWLMAALLLGGAVALAEGAASTAAASTWDPGALRIRLLVLAGVAFGLATLTKPTGQVLILAAPLVLAFATRSVRATIMGSVVVGLAMAAVVLPWLVHNAVKYDHFALTNQGGTALWYRVFDQDRAPIPADSADGRRANELYARYLEGPKNPAFTDPAILVGPEYPTESYQYVYNTLYREGLSRWEIGEFQRDLALEAVRRDPVLYGKGTVRNAWDYVTYNTRPFGVDVAKIEARPHTDETLGPVPVQLATGPWDASKLFLQLGFFASVAMLAVPLLLFVGAHRARVAAASMIVVWAAIVIAGSMTAAVASRYAAEVAPLQWILEAAAAAALFRLLVGAVRRLRERRARPA